MSNRKHAERTYVPGASYHVTLHSASMTKAFATRQNKAEYITRLANYHSPRETRDSSRHKYSKLNEEVTALTYCLLDDHLHLPVIDLEWIRHDKAHAQRNTGFAAYLDRAHVRRGPLFDAPFAAKPVADQDHARAVIAYTHLNHVSEPLDYEFCGHRALMGEMTIDWLDDRHSTLEEISAESTGRSSLHGSQRPGDSPSQTGREGHGIRIAIATGRFGDGAAAVPPPE